MNEQEKQELLEYYELLEERNNSQPEHDFDAVEMAKNIPGSLGQLAYDVTSPIHSPVQTYDAVSSLVKGIYSKVTDGNSPDEKTVDAMADFYVNKYGSIDGFQKALQEHPADILSDGVALVTLGATGASKLPGVIGSKANTVKNAAMAVDPINAAVNAGKVVGRKILPDSLPNSMMKSAMKFNPARYTEAERTQMAQTMLDNKITPNQAGMDKTRNLINESQGKVDSIIEQGTADGVYLPMDRLDESVGGLLAKKGDITNKNRVQETNTILNNWAGKVDPETGIRSGGWRDEIANQGGLWTPSQMQRAKVTEHGKVDYSKQSKPNKQVIDDYSKAVASGARKALEDFDPAIKDLNAKTKELLTLQNPRGSSRIGPLEQSTNRIANTNLISMPTLLKTIAMEAVAPGSGVATFLGSAAMTPVNRTKVASYMEGINRKSLLDNMTDNSATGLLLRKAAEEQEQMRQAGLLDY